MVYMIWLISYSSYEIIIVMNHQRSIYDPIVRPEMRQSWELKWKSWFVTTDAVEDQRCPGKLKSELYSKVSIFLLTLYFRGIFHGQGRIYCSKP